MNNKQNYKESSIETQHVVFKNEAHVELLKGAEILYNAVSTTMGPSGHSVIIDTEQGSPIITKDGVTVARSINLRNRLQSMGAELLKEVAGKTNDLAGDGTTSSVVLGYNLFKEGHKIISSGHSSINVKKGLDIGSDLVLEFLKKNCIPVSGKKDIVNVGTISANGDKEIGEIIAEAIEKVGVDGLITVEPAKSLKTTLRLAEGIQIDSGFLSPFFVTNGDKQTCELENPYVLITSGKISTLNDLIPILEQIDKADKPILIVADDVEGEALHTLVVNHTKKVIQVCAVKAPSYGENRADILADLGVVVNGLILGATSEVTLKNIKLAQLGKCKKVIVNRHHCTFLVENNAETKERIMLRADSIRNALNTDITLDEMRQVRYRERLAKLSGGIAVIQVGGSSEVEIREKKDRVDDAVNATQAAAQEGIVPGGGTALFYASQFIKSLIEDGKLKDHAPDVLAGIHVIANTCESPLRTIVGNTGVSPDVVCNKLLDHWKENKDLSFGYNAHTKKYCDLIKDGVLDPGRVSKCSLTHAVSIIGLTLTTSAVIVNDEAEK